MLTTAGEGSCLTADIGGTNARLAIINRLGEAPHHIRQYACGDFPGFEAVAEAYLADTGQSMPPKACFAVAGPVHDNKAKLTNGHWQIDGHHFGSKYQLDICALVNDFAGLAQSLPWLGQPDLMRIGPECTPESGARLVTGPGTGLGVATLVEDSGHRIAVAGEGGNVSFAPSDDLEIEVLQWFRKRMGGQVSVECLVSGRGLVDLHQALSEISGLAPGKMDGPEITRQGLADAASPARQTLMMFLGVLGGFAADLALINGARGGVYVGGGIVPRLAPLLPHSPFRAKFEDKGRYRAYLASIPSWLIIAQYPALTGAAAFVLDPACR